MKCSINISKANYTLAMLKVMNFQIGMTDYELDIVAAMVDNDILILDKAGREVIRKVTHKGVHTTNNYIKKLKDKKVLLEEDSGLVLNQQILIPILDKEVTVKFNVN